MNRGSSGPLGVSVQISYWMYFERDPDEGGLASPSCTLKRVLARQLWRLHPATFTVQELLNQLCEGTPWVVQHRIAAYVPMPSNLAAFSLWMDMTGVLLLLIDEHEKVKLRPICSPRLWLQSNW
ncbi:hypothetical protein AcW2_007362 [Taiwanofungus camphoratus]|nr:hypothetical protein AcW2_007362 [Antrodia cinnamomea]